MVLTFLTYRCKLTLTQNLKYKVVQIWPGLICVYTSRTAQQLCDLERVKPQPPPSLLLGLEPVQSCLGVARVMSEQKVLRSVEQRIVIKFLVGENVPSAEIHHRLQQQYGEECLRRNLITMRCSTLRGTFCSLITLATPRQDWTCSNPSRREGGWRLWLHSLKVAQLLRSAACLHTDQSRSYLNHLVRAI